MSSTVSRLAQRAVNLAMILVIVACALWLLPSVFGLDRYVITGRSMTGSIERGSVAFEEQVPVRDLEVGDVITYQPPPSSGVTSLVTHRIIAKRPGPDGRSVFRTQGDANADPDPWKFSLDRDTQPRVVMSVPYAGHVLIALADREVRMALIGGPATVVALISLVQLVGAVRRRGPGQGGGGNGADTHPASGAAAGRAMGRPLVGV